MAKTITIGTKKDDELLVEAIIQFQHKNALDSSPDAVRALCRQALNLKQVSVKFV